ncbi:MFS general substrate transporter, partial [Rhizodiscina lignyota]
DESPEAIEFKKKERKLVRKLDTFVAPVVMMLMLISYLDRGNIGFAATQGMNEDLNLKGSEYNIAVSLFYITYILAEFPASLLVKRLSFKRVMPAIAFGWGLICMCVGFVKGFASLVVLRLLLGFFEGCLFPALTLFLANWYKREELGLRVSYLFIASALSGAFGGLIALGILFMNGTAGYAGWRWLYIIEGIITIAFSFICYFLVPENYSTAYFLNAEEKAIMKHRSELMESYSGGDGKYTKKDIKLALTDIKTWLHGILQVAVLADRYNARWITQMICAPIGIAGYAILLNLDKVSPGVQYFATYLISTACYLCTGTNIAWHSMNTAPDGKRAAALGVQLTLTNIGGVISGQIYRDPPNYTLGHAWSLGSLGFAWCGWWILLFIYKRRDAWKAKARAEGVVIPSEDFSDRSPEFKYQ